MPERNPRGGSGKNSAFFLSEIRLLSLIFLHVFVWTLQINMWHFKKGKGSYHLKYRWLTIGEPENQYPTSKEASICITKREKYKTAKSWMEKRTFYCTPKMAVYELENHKEKLLPEKLSQVKVWKSHIQGLIISDLSWISFAYWLIVHFISTSVC